ncbi:MAG: hypothetical protein IKO60_01115 [Bacteroidaceae bacterium]|nr:hypothetical protein [Bacteroidaceae bacterium]
MNIRLLHGRTAFFRKQTALPGFTLHGGKAYAPRRKGSRSTEERLTLHGASAHAPRSIDPPSTELEAGLCCSGKSTGGAKDHRRGC